MDEFLKMIYKQWCRNEENENSINWGNFDEAVAKIEEILNEKIATDIECSINKEAWKIEENAFIAGFEYASKCLSIGKIEFSK